MSAARKDPTYVKENPEPTDFITPPRRLIFLKGKQSHDTNSAQPFRRLPITSLRLGRNHSLLPVFSTLAAQATKTIPYQSHRRA